MGRKNDFDNDEQKFLDQFNQELENQDYWQQDEQDEQEDFYDSDEQQYQQKINKQKKKKEYYVKGADLKQELRKYQESKKTSQDRKTE